MRALIVLALAVGCSSAPRPPSYPVHREVAGASGPIAILGQVQRPGMIAYRPNLRLVEALVECGGFTVFARKRHVRLRWTVNGQMQTVIVNVDMILEGLAPDPELLPGDIVFVEERSV